jgi:dynein heavy chain
VDSWVERRQHPELRPLLAPRFDRYVEPTLGFVRRAGKTLVPLPPICMVETLCKVGERVGRGCRLFPREAAYPETPSSIARPPNPRFETRQSLRPLQLLEGLLPSEPPRATAGGGAIPPLDRRLVETHFVFSCVWAFGGCLLVDRVADHRAAFAKWWAAEHKTVAFPPEVSKRRAACCMRSSVQRPATLGNSSWRAAFFWRQSSLKKKTPPWQCAGQRVRLLR